jgi:hypothetical protein
MQIRRNRTITFPPRSASRFLPFATRYIAKPDLNQGVFRMTKKMLLILTLLTCSAWMVAQSSPGQPQSPNASGSGSAGQTSPGYGSQTGSQSGTGTAAGQDTTGTAQSSSGMNGNETKLRGCLSSSGSGYTLTDASGTTYQLTGETSKLSSNVNKEVEVKGTTSGASGASGGAAASGAGSETSAGSQTAGTPSNSGAGQMFNVTKVKKVSNTCNNASQSK